MLQNSSSCHAESCTDDFGHPHGVDGWTDVLLLLPLAAYHLISVLLEQLVRFDVNGQISVTLVWPAARLCCFTWDSLLGGLSLAVTLVGVQGRD